MLPPHSMELLADRALLTHVVRNMAQWQCQGTMQLHTIMEMEPNVNHVNVTYVVIRINNHLGLPTFRCTVCEDQLIDQLRPR
eukprot:m.257124 g.257124  ORF g.257124 m.257124 type:complete len:82 (-) comp26580_c0_seq4:2687-2932(-)